MKKLYAGLEAGGTKFNCMIASGPEEIIDTAKFPTTTPEETLESVKKFFRKYKDDIVSMGIGSFGPVDPNPNSDTFGYITTTPKKGWANTNIAGELAGDLQVPFGFDTDVNAAALGEYTWGAAQSLSTFVYMTIGTGVGGGGMVEGKLMHGLVHPEMGHILLRRDPVVDPFPGTCPYHGDCFEGLCAGPAIQERWGKPGKELPDDHKAWPLEASYIGQGLANLTVTLSPQRFILGGGVMHQEQLFPMVRKALQKYLNGYVQSAEILGHIDAFVVPPQLGDNAGMLGSIALAMQAEKKD